MPFLIHPFSQYDKCWNIIKFSKTKRMIKWLENIARISIKEMSSGTQGAGVAGSCGRDPAIHSYRHHSVLSMYVAGNPGASRRSLSRRSIVGVALEELDRGIMGGVEHYWREGGRLHWRGIRRGRAMSPRLCHKWTLSISLLLFLRSFLFSFLLSNF